jgi:hypothetical protein
MRSSAQPGPAPPIACCGARAQRRKPRRGSNRRWIILQWQVRTSAARAITSRSARDAQAVHDYLVAEGDTASRIKTISYGKERLVATYDDGSCRSQTAARHRAEWRGEKLNTGRCRLRPKQMTLFRASE